jgi:hypothetical protein
MNREASKVKTRFAQRVAIAASASVVMMAMGITPVAHAAPSVGYWFDYIPGTGQTDMVLTPDAISNAVRQGLRAGGIAATANSGNVDALVSVEMVESYEPQFNSLRIVSGTILLKVPRPGAGNFERPILLCVTSVQAWRTSSNTQEAARKVRDGIVQKAADFARECRPQLNNL